MEQHVSLDDLLDPPPSVFVYGTLKRGYRNEHVWPTIPLHVESAWVRGRLFGRADYPALIPGNDAVAGELWTFEPAKIKCVVAALDELEGTTTNSERDLYHRVIVDVHLNIGSRDEHSAAVLAFTYFYNGSPEERGFRRVLPERGICRWLG